MSIIGLCDLLCMGIAILTLISGTFAGALFIWVFTCGRHRSAARPLYPPGPPIRGLLSGNAKDLASKFPWLAYTEWAKKYGDLLHFRAYNQHIIVLNSEEAAIELLERRSAIYSSRPFVPMWDLMGASYATGVRDYSPEWQSHRRIFQQILRQSAAARYRPTQTEKIKDMLLAMLTSPDEFRAHLHTTSGAIIMSVMYGYDVAPASDPFVALVEVTQDVFEHGVSLNWLVNSVPVLRHVPAWCPGAGFKRYAISVKSQVVEQLERPFEYVLDKVAAGTARHSVVSSLLDGCKSEKDLQILREVAGTGYGAGVNTTASTLLVFIVAMISNPEIQTRVQHEIDSVTGGDRLVEYSDHDSLPYLEAILREVIRWRPITPLGLPHANNDEDVYQNFYIPKGSLVISNIWAMTRNDAKYKNPDTFDPDRFLDANGALTDDEIIYAFGFGRRICPGRHLAIASVWLMMATMLQVFDLRQRKDPSGKDIPLNIEWDDALVCSPLPFQCSITPRSEKIRRLVLNEHEKN